MDVTKVETADNNGRPVLTFRSPKFKQALIVSKENNGFSFFNIRWEKGSPVSKELSGSYSRLTSAEEDVLAYIRTAPKSRAKRTEDNNEAREQRKSKK